MLDNNFNSQGIMNAILTTLLHIETMALISQSSQRLYYDVKFTTLWQYCLNVEPVSPHNIS